MLASIIRNIPRQLNIVTPLVSNSARTFFTPSYFGIDSFKNYASNIEKDQGKNASSLKVNIEEALSKPDGKIFTEDLKTMLYLTKTDADLDLLLNAIRKYQKQESMAIFSFNFETPLIRLLYSLNKTDRALGLFMDNKESVLKKFYTAGTILMNKLMEEKRYEDTIKIMNRLLNQFRQDKKADPNSRLRTMDLSNLATEALLGLNTPEALNQAKQFLKDFIELNLEFHDNAYIKLILLSHNQNQFDFAYELTSRIKNKSQNVVNNLKLLSLLRLGRVDDALKLAEDTNKIVLNKGVENKLFFKETIAVLQDLSGKLDGEKQNRIKDVLDSVKQENKFIDLSLNDYALRLREEKNRPFQQQQGQQGQPRQRTQGQGQQQQRQQDGQQSRPQFRNQYRKQGQDRQQNADNKQTRIQKDSNQRDD